MEHRLPLLPFVHLGTNVSQAWPSRATRHHHGTPPAACHSDSTHTLADTRTTTRVWLLPAAAKAAKAHERQRVGVLLHFLLRVPATLLQGHARPHSHPTPSWTMQPLRAATHPVNSCLPYHMQGRAAHAAPTKTRMLACMQDCAC